MVTLTHVSVWACCSVIAACCAMAALHHRYDDNLLQRLGLGGTALSMAGIAAQDGWATPIVLVLISLAIFCVGAAYKFKKRMDEKRLSSLRSVK